MITERGMCTLKPIFHCNAKPLTWALWRWACRFHVACALFPGVGQPTRTRFQVEYGLKYIK